MYKFVADPGSMEMIDRSTGLIHQHPLDSPTNDIAVHKNEITIHKNDINYNHKSDMLKMANTNVPDTQDDTVVGIWISCHGSIETPIVKISNIPDVEITKITYSGFCANTHMPIVFNPVIMKTKALSLLHDFRFAFTKSEYLSSLDRIATSTLDMENSSTMFTNPPNGWITKSYEGGRNLMLMISYKNKAIDLFQCSREELHEFINISNPKIAGTINVILTNRDRNQYITTQDLFTLIKIFKKEGVKTVRIVDESCNNGSLDNYPDPNTGYGGKKSRKHNKKRKPKTLRKKIQ